MTTQSQEINNMRLISHHDLGGFGNIGEGVHLHQTKDGRRILYMAHESAPKDITSVDVTDIANPKLMVQTELDYTDLRSNSPSIIDDVMLVAYESKDPGQPGTGMGFYNISNPEEPRRIGFFDTTGPYSRGCHCLWWVDGNYAHLATGASDFQPRNQKDDQFYMIVDVKDPTRPVEAGRWWFPGTREGDDAPMPARHPKFDAGHRLHNGNVYPDRPDRAYCAYMDSGVAILDIADKSRPQMISNINYAPPFPGFTHTVVPFFNRDLMVVTQESVRPGGEDFPKLVWLMDIQDESKPVIIGTLPMPDTEDFFNRPGRFGGSCFWFTARLGRQKSAGEGNFAKVAAEVKDRRVLVVDDNAVNRLVSEKHLSALGARVTVVSGGHEALAALGEAAGDDPFEVAIIDHMMPEMDGVELRRRIRGEPRYDGIRLVLSSSSGLAVTYAGAGELGFDAALPKPLRRTAMLECLANLYDLEISRDQAQAVRQAVSGIDRQGSKRRILVVEDNKVNQILACTILDNAGYKTDVAGNGIEALQALASRRYDLVLMDMNMPEMDGLEATTEIRKLAGQMAEIPIIAMTANAMKGDRERCLMAGMNDYASKPIDTAKLLERIAFWLGGELVGGASESPAPAESEAEARLEAAATAVLDDLLGTLDEVAGG